VRDAGPIRTLLLAGDYAKRDSHRPQWTDRGQEGHFEGELEIDTRSMQITRLRGCVESTAWSDATYSPVSPPPKGRYTLLTALVEATDELARQVPPEPAATGNYYLRSELPGRVGGRSP
jgi:hypothetical protein